MQTLISFLICDFLANIHNIYDFITSQSLYQRFIEWYDKPLIKVTDKFPVIDNYAQTSSLDNYPSAYHNTRPSLVSGPIHRNIHSTDKIKYPPTIIATPNIYSEIDFDIGSVESKSDKHAAITKSTTKINVIETLSDIIPKPSTPPKAIYSEFSSDDYEDINTHKSESRRISNREHLKSSELVINEDDSPEEFGPIIRKPDTPPLSKKYQ